MKNWLMILSISFFAGVFSAQALALESTDLMVKAPAEAASATATVVETAKPILETEIPVHLEAAKKSGAADSPWMRMFLGVLITAILAGGGYVFLKKAKFKSAKSEPTPEIKVLAQHHLGPKKTLTIVRVAGESILIGVTEHSISLIKSLSLLDEDIPSEVPQSFEKVMDSTDDEFSISQIKDVVTTRLKNFRSLQ